MDGADFVIETSAGEQHARRATSCLLEPAPGDSVLVALVSRGTSYVLAVLSARRGRRGASWWTGTSTSRWGADPSAWPRRATCAGSGREARWPRAGSA